MADWIKVETISSQKIEVLTMADILDMDEHMVFGKLVILWCWADANTVDGNAQNVTKRMIDRVACSTGFADAMLDERVGWLKQDENGNLSFSNFERHNGKGAKKRATTARRVKEYRENVTQIEEGCNATSVTNDRKQALPEKIREDKIIDINNNAQFDYELVAEIWNRSCDESNTPSKKCRVVSEATKKNMPVTYKKHCAIRKAGGHEPLDRVEFCESYFPAVLNWGSSFVGKHGQHENWKMNLEHASKIGTYDKVAEWLAND